MGRKGDSADSHNCLGKLPSSLTLLPSIPLYLNRQQQQQPRQPHGQQTYGAQQQGQFAQQAQFSPPEQQQQQQYPSTVVIPMDNLSSSSTTTNDMSSFFTEVTLIQEDITRLSQNVTQIEALHDQSVNGVATEDQTSRLAHQLDNITDDTRQLTNRIKKRIKDIELANLRLANANSPDIQIRRTQANTLKEKFVVTLRRYQTAESQASQKYRGRLERQYRIVKPEATEQEIQQVLENDNHQVFAQSVLHSTRYGDANRAMREVQTRHVDIKKIEKTIMELHQLFTDMETLVAEQGQVVATIEDNTVKTDTHLKQGDGELKTAIVNAYGARRKKWICLFISIIIIAILVVLICKFA
ncbi:Plasma membrane t-SNARE, secretory vesicle fusion, partial [Podila humilis]